MIADRCPQPIGGSPVLCAIALRRSIHNLTGEGLNFEIDACDLIATAGMVISRALAEFSETDVAVLAQLNAGGN